MLFSLSRLTHPRREEESFFLSSGSIPRVYPSTEEEALLCNAHFMSSKKFVFVFAVPAAGLKA